jgi:hypothetical protein
LLNMLRLALLALLLAALVGCATKKSSLAPPGGSSPTVAIVTPANQSAPGPSAEQQRQAALTAQIQANQAAIRQSASANQAANRQALSQRAANAEASAQAGQERAVSERAASVSARGPAPRDDVAIANCVAGVVEGGLKNPAGANWGAPIIAQAGPDTTDKQTRQVVKTYSVRGSVDCTNSYGATGRVDYSGLVVDNGGRISLVPGSLDIDDRLAPE